MTKSFACIIFLLSYNSCAGLLSWIVNLPNTGDECIVYGEAWCYDGFQFSGREDGVWFDLLNIGTMQHLTWVAPFGDDAFLFWDKNKSGIVENGSELFGHGSFMLDQDKPAPNGFVALAQHDEIAAGGNNDSYVTAEDSVYSELLFWVDYNADAVCSPSEVFSLESAGITELQVIPWYDFQMDQHRNVLKYWANAFGFETKLQMVDVFFRRAD